MNDMNNIVDKFFKIGDKFMPEMHLKSLDLLIVLVVHLLKTNKEFKSLWRQEIQNTFTEIYRKGLFLT